MTTLEILKKAKALEISSAPLTTEQKNTAIMLCADALCENAAEILAANAKDVENARGKISEVMIDRLRLDETRISAMADGMRAVAQLPDPVGRVLEDIKRADGLDIKKISVPMGVVAIIYESRPNVTSDAAALCFKSGNICILRSGKEAYGSARAIVTALKKGLITAGLSEDYVNLIEDTTRASANELMTAEGYVDLLIPRGGKGLIRSVVENATVPTIETGAGNCNAYVEKSADFETALSIIRNGKTSRPAVCNALEHVLVDREIAKAFLPLLKDALPGVKLKGDAEAAAILGVEEVGDDEFFVEYDDLILSAKVVGGIEEAIAHINAHSTKHSDVILTTDLRKADAFTRAVDSAAVYVNASTRFTDGGEFGFGAEIGISTQKLHARGPMGLTELTTVKYIVTGDGQIR